jgi:valyl-tRNA synthetase
MSNGGSYDPHAVEPQVYRFWEEGNYFHAVPDPNRKPYVIDIPLPNVTGSLHVGHALNNTVQDVLIRYKRMCGFNAMWMPGTDHAGIATQAVVEKKLKEEENLTRHELGRDGLVERIWAWKEKYGGQILQQLRRIGCSCDWERTRFTLDEVCAKAVYEVFFQWFKAGLIYRGLRLVNWDAALQTAVADDEIIHETVQGHLWHYRYPIAGSVGVSAAQGGIEGSRDQGIKEALARATRSDAKLGEGYLVIATTRPETMLGDTAVAVHPDDKRYKHLIGKHCLLPLMNRRIPIIADEVLVDPSFGTGCVKVTPGHDPNDYEFGQRHNVPMINILTPDGRINDNGGKYAGMTIEESRRRVVEDLEALGLMEKVEPYQHEVGHSDRSKTPIEPMLSEQWFVKMADLCELAMGAVRDGRVKFFPERYAKTYLDWLGEKRDWCISRQLWWGHRIPVWTFKLGLDALMALLKHDRPIPDPDREAWNLYNNFPKDHPDLVGGQAFESMPDIEGMSIERREALQEERKRGKVVLAVQRAVVKGTLHLCLREENHPIGVQLEAAGYERDPGVLDTWFSSALWPFSTLGWPDDYGRGQGIKGSRDQGLDHGATDSSIPRSLDPSIPPTDLEYFYPTSTLVTAREIITLWVARMVMTGLYFMKDVPFHHVHIHPNIQDGQGRRMSKSAGNGVDPLDLIELYGADAMRFTIVQMSTETQDIRMPVSYLCPHCGGLVPQDSVVPKNKVPAEVQKVTCKQCKKPFATVWATDDLKRELGVARDTSDRFELGRNFCNKVWQAATGFVIPNLPGAAGFSPRGAGDGGWPRPLKPEDLAVEDHWILSRLSACIEEVDRRFEGYALNDVASTLYAFFWGEFCDWYVELVKPRLFSRTAAGEMVRHDDESSHVARQVLAWVLDQSLRLLHPIMPFITEELWRRLNEAAPQRGIDKIRTAGPASGRGVGPPRPTADADTISSALIVARWPDATAWKREAGVERDMQALQDVIRALRDIRTHVNKIRSAARQGSIQTLPHAVVKAASTLVESLRRREAMIHRLGQCERLEIGDDVAKPSESASKVLSGVEVYVPLTGLADLEIERERLRKEHDELAGHVRHIEGKLASEGFVSKAPPAVVNRERARLAELREKMAAVARHLAEVGG